MVQEDHDATPHFAAVKAFTDEALAKVLPLSSNSNVLTPSSNLLINPTRTLYPNPQTRNLKPETPNHTPQTMNHEPYTRQGLCQCNPRKGDPVQIPTPKPYTINPKP